MFFNVHVHDLIINNRFNL